MSNLATSEPNLAEIEKEVIAWYKSYSQAWYEGNPDVETSASYYAVPTYFALPDGVIPILEAKVESSFFAQFICRSQKQGLD